MRRNHRQKNSNTPTHPSRIDTIINPPEFPDRQVYKILHGLGVSHVELDTQSLVVRSGSEALALLRGLGRSGCIDIGEQHASCTGLGKGEACFFSDPTGTLDTERRVNWRCCDQKAAGEGKQTLTPAITV
jgi:hypothetical protein